MFSAKKRPNVNEMKAKGDVNGLAKALSYKNKDDSMSSQIRSDATRALVEIGCIDAKIVNLIIETLRDEDEYVRAMIPLGLGQLSPKIKDLGQLKQIIDSLVLALKDEASCATAAWALGEICTRNDVDLQTRTLLVRPLIDALKFAATISAIPYDPRDYVAQSLWHVGEPAVTALIDMLEDENEDVRWPAAGALGNIKDARAVKPLIPLLNDKSSLVCLYAVVALGNIGDKQAVKPLMNCKAQNSENKKLIEAIDTALEKIK